MIQRKILKDITCELDFARNKFHNYHSYHEGYAVIKEELDEVWDLVKGSEDKELMYNELIQVATTTIRFIQDLILTKGSHNGKK